MTTLQRPLTHLTGPGPLSARIARATGGIHRRSRTRQGPRVKEALVLGSLWSTGTQHQRVPAEWLPGPRIIQRQVMRRVVQTGCHGEARPAVWGPGVE